MFVFRSEQTISPGKAEEYSDYQKASMDAVRQQPGFLWDAHLIYLGNYARRLVLQGWESKESRLAYSRGSATVRPAEHVLTGPAMTEFYDVVAETRETDLSVGQFVILRHLRLRNGSQAEFEAIEAGLSDLAREQEGFVARSSLKFLGNDTTYLRCSVWHSWADLEQWTATPTYAAENEAIMNHVVWTSADRYEVQEATSKTDKEALERLNWESLSAAR